MKLAIYFTKEHPSPLITTTTHKLITRAAKNGHAPQAANTPTNVRSSTSVTTFRIGKILQVFGTFLKASISFGQNFKTSLGNFYAFGRISVVSNGPIFKNNLTIWSHWVPPTCSCTPASSWRRNPSRRRSSSWSRGRWRRSRTGLRCPPAWTGPTWQCRSSKSFAPSESLGHKTR